MYRMKRIMIQIITLLVMITMIGSGSATSETTVSIADLTCNDGGTVTADVVLTDIQNYGTGTINITYNPEVVHVTGVAGNSDSTIITHNEDNTAGITRISAWNTDGVSGNVVFASVTFEAVGTGYTTLGIEVPKLRDTSLTTPISFEIVNGSITIAGNNLDSPTPFVITGHVSDSNGDPCNDPWVQITNTNTNVIWDAENSSASNYYRLVLDSDDVSAGNVLHFDVTTDGMGNNSTDHTMTSDEVNAGGISGFNLTLELPVNPAPYLVTYTISNTTISPNGDGVEDDTEIDVKFSESVDAVILIENASGVVRSLYTSSSVVNPNPKTWDGTNDGGNLVTAGTYHVNVTMDDGINPVVYNNTRSIVVTCSDIISPTVTSNTPTGTEVPITTVITATFDESMDTASVEGAFSTNPSVTGTSSWSGDTMTFTPNDDLAYSTTYEVTIGTGAEDLAGNPLAAAYVWDFTTGSEPDITPPASVTDLQNITYQETYINWTWDDPADGDFSEVMVYLDGISQPNVTKGNQFYNATGLTADTEHEISTRTVDDLGNINDTVVNHTARTKPSPVEPVTVSIGSAEGSVGDSVNVSINITNASNIGAMDIRVEYNVSILHATNVANGSMIESLPAPIVAYHIGYIDVNISFVTVPETIDGDGELFIVTFDLIGGEAGDSSPLEIEAEAYRADVPPQPVQVEPVDGVVTVVGVPDTTPPVITDVTNETPTSSSVAIVWTTDEASNSIVRYGTESDNYTYATSGGAMTTSHVIQLSGLTPNTAYYFVVNSTDASGNANESIEYSFMTMAMTEVGVAIDCATIRSDPSCRTTVNITLSGIEDYGSGTTHLYFDEDIVEVDSIGEGESGYVQSHRMGAGHWKISASNADGLSGDVIFATVTFKPAGPAHGHSDLDLTVETLYDRNSTALQTTTINCSISIYESNPPIVTNPSASRQVILNDNGRARVPGTNVSTLSVYVTDDTEVDSVTIDLSPIRGAGYGAVPMVLTSGTKQAGTWSVKTNADYDPGVNLTHCLAVDATDVHGNSETASCVTLTVLRRGDVHRDNQVDIADYNVISRYTVGLEPLPNEFVAGIAPADSYNGVDMADALYIAMYATLNPIPGYAAP